jgi:hypothetical protein
MSLLDNIEEFDYVVDNFGHCKLIMKYKDSTMKAKSNPKLGWYNVAEFDATGNGIAIDIVVALNEWLEVNEEAPLEEDELIEEH